MTVSQFTLLSNINVYLSHLETYGQYYLFTIKIKEFLGRGGINLTASCPWIFLVKPRTLHHVMLLIQKFSSNEMFLIFSGHISKLRTIYFMRPF